MIMFYELEFMLYLAFILFVFGLVIGSFLNVVIYRTIHGQSFVTGRSKCPGCHQTIAWYDNIPVISFLLLRRKCRHCGRKISWQYPAVELITGLLFVWWYAVGFAFFQLSQRPLVFIQPLFWLTVGILLVIILMTDWLYQIIPDYATIAIGLLSLSYRLYLAFSGAMQWSDFWLAVASGMGLMAFLFALWWGTKGRGMGFGDVKFALVMGILLGWPRSIVALFLAFLLGAFIGLIMIFLKWKTIKEKIAFGPFLVAGTIIALLWGNQLWFWYWNLL